MAVHLTEVRGSSTVSACETSIPVGIAERFSAGVLAKPTSILGTWDLSFSVIMKLDIN